jgi:aspartate ammonia-lyase
MEIPADAYWGIHTAGRWRTSRSPCGPISVYKDLVTALAMVKQASARANLEIGSTPNAPTSSTAPPSA